MAPRWLWREPTPSGFTTLGVSADVRGRWQDVFPFRPSGRAMDLSADDHSSPPPGARR